MASFSKVISFILVQALLFNTASANTFLTFDSHGQEFYWEKGVKYVYSADDYQKTGISYLKEKSDTGRNLNGQETRFRL